MKLVKTTLTATEIKAGDHFSGGIVATVVRANRHVIVTFYSGTQAFYQPEESVTILRHDENA